MLFRSSGSKKSNASNGVQFGVEMKELQPLQADHSKLKEEFCTALRNHPFVARWFRSLFVQCCVSPLKFPVMMEAEYRKLKANFAALRSQPFAAKWFRSPFLCVYEISQTSFSPVKWSLVLPDICDWHIEIFFFRFLLSKSLNSPCKPPIILAIKLGKRVNIHVIIIIVIFI